MLLSVDYWRKTEELDVYELDPILEGPNAGRMVCGVGGDFWTVYVGF